MNPWVRFSRWLHRRLARAFPHEFQVLHGNELEQMGEDAIPFVWRQFGFFGLVQLLGAAIAGLIREYFVEFWCDVRYALRRLAASPGFTVLAVVSLALCVGMASLFPLQISALMGSAPGIEDPDSLVAPEQWISYPYYDEYRKQSQLFSASTAFLDSVTFTLGEADERGKRKRARGHVVSLDYFSTLGVTPAAGRLLDAANDGPGAAPAMVITDDYWRSQLAADPDVIGSVLRINGSDVTIVGITPESFRGAFPGYPAAFFLPFTAEQSLAVELRDDLFHNPAEERLRVIFRLADGVTAEQAEAALQVIGRNLDQQRPESERPPVERVVPLMPGGATMRATREQRVTQVSFALLMGSLLLGIACANLAVLLLARGSERRKEIAIRLSVGASRFRLIRQQLTESVTLALCGGVAGVMVVLAVLRLQTSLTPEGADQIELVYGGVGSIAPFVLGLSALAGLLFGLAPAWSSVRGELLTPLKQGGQAQLRAYSRFGIRNQFMLLEIAASLLLMLITGYVVVGYQQSLGMDPGFETEDLYLVAIDPIRDGYSFDKIDDLLAQLEGRLEKLPDIEAAALSRELPYFQPIVTANHTITVPETDGKQAVQRVVRQRIGAGYFRTLGVPLLSGREFSLDDQLDSSEERPKPIVLNQAAVERLFAGANPLGRTIRDDEGVFTVAGVVKDLSSGFMMATPAPTMFVPLTSRHIGATFAPGVTVLLRGRPGAAPIEAATKEILTVDPELTIFDPQTFDQQLAQFDRMIQWSSILNGSLAAFAMLLSLIGLFSITVHAVARRRKEIGIRVALGARRDQIMRLVLREGIALVAVGGVLGFAAAFALVRVFSSITSRLAEVFALGTDDPLFTVAAPLVWASVALLACYLPARRALKIDPASTLKAE